MSQSAEQRLSEIVAEFADLEPRERLELLLDFAEGLPELPEELRAERNAADHRVHECMTPVYLWVLPDAGRLRIHAEVAPEAPTVKGFVGILVDAFTGATPEEVALVAPDVIRRLGLIEALGMARMRGLSGVLHRIQTEARRLSAARD